MFLGADSLVVGGGGQARLENGQKKMPGARPALILPLWGTPTICKWQAGTPHLVRYLTHAKRACNTEKCLAIQMTHRKICPGQELNLVFSNPRLEMDQLQ